MFSIDHFSLRPPRFPEFFFEPFVDPLFGRAFGWRLGCRLPLVDRGAAGREDGLVVVGLGVADRFGGVAERLFRSRPADELPLELERRPRSAGGLAVDAGCRLVRRGRAICS